MIDYDPAEDDPRAKVRPCIGRTEKGTACGRTVRFAVTSEPDAEYSERLAAQNTGPFCTDHRDQKPKAPPKDAA